MQLSIIVPVFNESASLPIFHKAVSRAVAQLSESVEFLYVDDGSTDSSVTIIQLLAASDSRIRLLELSRNFGKEVALAAGLAESRGDAAIILDADLQHPPELIPEFVSHWHAGAEVVIGLRQGYQAGWPIKRLNSWLFYKILNSMAETKVIRGATDYRLLDRAVINEFNLFSERNRITRGLIDWLGFRREYIPFNAPPRKYGQASYSFPKLIRLAINSFVSLSLFPLKIAGYLGMIIMSMSAFVGIFILIEQHLLRDPWHLSFSGSAQLTLVNIFLIGIVLSSLGLIALYIANIHSEVINRPLYVLRRPLKRQQTLLKSDIEAEVAEIFFRP